MKLLAKVLMVVLASFALAACAKDVSPNTYDTEAVGTTSRVEPGVIVATRIIKIDQNTGMGGLAGAGAGAVAGSAIGGSGRANLLGAIGGAVIGGLAGNAIEKKVNSDEGVEYIIKLNNGSVVSIAQSKDLQLSAGQHVLVIYGSPNRIIADTTQPNTFDNTPPKPAVTETVSTSTTTTTTTVKQNNPATPASDTKK